MQKIASALCGPVAWIFLTSAVSPPELQVTGTLPLDDGLSVPLARDPVPLLPSPVALADLLSDGVVVVVSKPSQQMIVFKDGMLWGTSKVSTGKRGKSTPSGVFAILQKKSFHRSNLYSNAPMPFMQRLTWSGIAIHAGHLPGYPASHGCIRLPQSFAKSLYGLTGHSSTAVIVTDEPVMAEDAARRIAAASDAIVPMDLRFREERRTRLANRGSPSSRSPDRVPVSRFDGDQGHQTIQLSAATSAQAAQQHWDELVQLHPDLARMQRTIQPATVKSRSYFRLRASSSDAFLTCDRLRRSGVACFAVS